MLPKVRLNEKMEVEYPHILECEDIMMILYEMDESYNSQEKLEFKPSIFSRS